MFGVFAGVSRITCRWFVLLFFSFPDFYLLLHLFVVQESGDDEYHGEHSDTEDEVDSDFDIDEGDEPDSDQEEDAPRRKSRVVTKAYKVMQDQSNFELSWI